MPKFTIVHGKWKTQAGWLGHGEVVEMSDAEAARHQSCLVRLPDPVEVPYLPPMAEPVEPLARITFPKKERSKVKP